MSPKNLSLTELLDLIELEDYRGIISKADVLKAVKAKGMPRVISDIRGAVRLAVEREGDGFSVTQYPTELANESLGEIYPTANTRSANDNNIIDQAA
ncbi:hypothetical protein KJ657_02360 [Patescibacteria group bacterium]|nr:hypothetical protein [Patescibacteria group bacterium]MBU1015910.1 hypothetical protein [Patescibacteria group bacterium]MBU1685079.1 hypothetical protein [Patescibacteria group bacterium]MBU1938158.1 hypothetical protein [Patescibacteria group bacterium]